MKTQSNTYNIGDIIYCLYDSEPYKGEIYTVSSIVTTEDDNITYTYTAMLYQKGTNNASITVNLDDCKFVSTSTDEFEMKVSMSMEDVANGETKEEENTSIGVTLPYDQRMYVLVERHLSAIDKGIQAAHAIADYAFKYHNENDYLTWACHNKTIILLDGGTTNSLREIYVYLEDNGVDVIWFDEPDMNGLTTAVAFLADERVYDTEQYKDFEYTTITYTDMDGNTRTVLCDDTAAKHRWLVDIGGRKNEVKREVLKGKHLAR